MSGMHILERSQCAIGAAVPPTIAPFITQEQFSSGGVCFMTGFVCIFCAHPCIADFMVGQALPPKLNALNHTLFGGLPVLSSFGGKIAFNTTILQQHGRLPVVIVEAHYAVPVQTNFVGTAPAAPVQYAHVATPTPDQQYSKY